MCFVCCLQYCVEYKIRILIRVVEFGCLSGLFCFFILGGFLAPVLEDFDEHFLDCFAYSFGSFWKLF